MLFFLSISIFVDAGSSSALAKLVELSKRNREMTAELEAEKSRVKQLNNQIKTLEVQVATLMSQITNQSGNEQGVCVCVL